MPCNLVCRLFGKMPTEFFLAGAVLEDENSAGESVEIRVCAFSGGAVGVLGARFGSASISLGVFGV